MGQALADMGVAGDVVLKRGDAFPASPTEGPIYVCTRNDALQGVIDQTPESRRPDLVFLQNGMLQPWRVSSSPSHAPLTFHHSLRHAVEATFTPFCFHHAASRRQRAHLHVCEPPPRV